VSREALLASLPDVPRWVELRSLLLAGRGEILGCSAEPLACAVSDPAFGSAIVVGRPPPGAIGEAFALAGPEGTVLGTPENRAWIEAALPELRVERVLIHELAATSLPQPRPGDVRQLASGDLTTLVLPPGLHVELAEAAAAGTPIAAALADGMPVAFCYAGSITESLWDVAIDTLDPWRRRGYATRVAAFEIERLLKEGRRPVWGAVESNGASRGLASKLGFVPVDELWIFHPAWREHGGVTLRRLRCPPA
jgi:GNAT superfamily N-acetyltransferase